MERKPENAAGNNLQTKGKRGAKEKQEKMFNPETKDNLLAGNGEITNKEGPASDEGEEKKKTESDYSITMSYGWCRSLLYNPEEYFLSTILYM